jgi:rhomboid protease GluP
MGPVTERMYGSAGYAVLYLLAGLTGSLASVYWHPMTPSVGASGAVFGVMGAVLAYTARQRHALPPSVLRSIASSVGQAVAINLVLGFAVPHIDMAAHVGGLLGGGAAGLMLAGDIEEPAARRRRRAAIVAILGGILIVAAARQIPVFDDWLGTAARLERVEKDTDTRLAALPRVAVNDETGRKQIATTITSQVLPPWIAMRDELARLRLPDAEHDVIVQRVQYMDLWTEALRLRAEGYRTGDVRLLQQGREKTLAAMAVKARLEGREPPE